LKKVLLIIISGVVGLAGCGANSLRGNNHLSYAALHQSSLAPILPFADPFSLNLYEEPLQIAPASIIQAHNESSNELSDVASNPKDGEEESLFLAEEKQQDPHPAHSVAPSLTLTEKEFSGEASPLVGGKEGLWGEVKIAPAGNTSPSATIPEGPASEDDLKAAEESSFRQSDAQAEDLLNSSSEALLSPFPLSNKMDPPATSQNPASTLSTLFPSELNEKVGEFITFFQQRAESFFSKALARSQLYEDMMKKIFREKDLPEELFYLALIESGYNPHAISSARAGGIWQFIGKTAKRFGLRVDKWVDERRDPEKSTYAAAEYLKSLYAMFNCWDLATAGYNAGEGKILRAMKKANSQDFWEISRYRYLKQETKRYVPMFLAAVIIAKEPQKYGFSNINYHPPLVYEKVVVPPETNLDWIAKVSETDSSELRALNPSLRRGKTPPGAPHFEIKLPPGKKEVFEKNLFASKQSAVMTGRKHLVRSGETLGIIAKKYRIKHQALCELNDLSSQSKIKPGMMLLLPP
jgi:LysM repeat protein